MSIQANANSVHFYLYNSGREAANPPVVFPNVTPATRYTFCIWVYPWNNTPAFIFAHWGNDGSNYTIGHDGVRWYISSRQGAVANPIDYFANVTFGTWSCICVSHEGDHFHIYMGTQVAVDPHLAPVTLTHVWTYVASLNFTHNYIAVIAPRNVNLSCFKIWNDYLDLSQAQVQCHRWDANPMGAGIAPFWASTLRTPGDLSNIANPYATYTWHHGHAYTIIWPPNSLDYGGDPAYIANNMPCPTWVYPVGHPQTIPNSSYNPGTTPAVTTTYKGTQFWSFEDRGSVSPTDFHMQSILHYGYPSPAGAGVQATSTWGLYKDENGVEVLPSQADPANRFEQDTGVVIPGTIKASTMYLWKFGAQFTWDGRTPAVPTATANLSHILLYATYIGYPTGVPVLPAVDLAGLFAIAKGKSVDRYNRGVELKIPDPTIKTAFIGE